MDFEYMEDPKGDGNLIDAQPKYISYLVIAWLVRLVLYFILIA
jgi:hypothetical protein